MKPARDVGIDGRATAVVPVASRLFITITAGIAFCIFFLASPAVSAQILTGKVTNGTTGKPGAGDDVELITLGQGMEKAAPTRADAGGHFTFQLPDSGPHLIRAIHQAVTYYRMAAPGTSFAEVQVFDVSSSVADVGVTADVLRLQAKGDELQGTRLFVVNNASNPPLTQMHGKAFEFFIPDGAQIDQGMAMTAGGDPIKVLPVAGREKNQYRFTLAWARENRSLSYRNRRQVAGMGLVQQDLSQGIRFFFHFFRVLIDDRLSGGR